MTTKTINTDFLVEMKGISKSFFGTQALKNVDFKLKKGEVHVLFGENGAGKSTLMSILAGVIKPTRGDIYVNNKKVRFSSVQDSKNNGIGTVFQEFSLVPTLTVAENIFLGSEPSQSIFLNKKQIVKESLKYFEDLEFEIEVHKKVSELSRAEQQMVEIVKAFKENAKVLILDEPTASLTDKEVSKLFSFINKAREKGVGIVYISHRIQEFREIADKITVLRDGQLIDTFFLDKISDKELVECMAGRAIDKIYPKITKNKEDKTALSLINFQPKGLDPLSLDVKSGEVLGVAGLVGSGKSRFWRSLMGLEPIVEGAAILNGKDVCKKSTKKVIQNGIFYLTSDRKKEGLQLLANTELNIKANVLLRKDVVSKYGVIRKTKQSEIAESASNKSDINKKYYNKLVSSLSGGNQQKILFAKGLVSQFEVYILDEPSVGVDVGTREIIYLLIKELVEAGKAVIVISSDLPEVINLSHRVLVFSKGKVVKELKDKEINEKNILNNFF
ncbi:sugar ABC transporter ATP-binding protein [Tenacibaculum xiamenense]|uniref:sugar ABC transporter ATP-binding protein n=1 Tax=Tenacibaculum xiamenense TaxID=1261553 RepID=UPI003894ECE9